VDWAERQLHTRGATLILVARFIPAGRLGKTLKQWREAFLAYFDTRRANNGGTEAINGLIELHRRVARGFGNRDNYRLRMLFIGGGLSHPPDVRRATMGAEAPGALTNGCPNAFDRGGGANAVTAGIVDVGGLTRARGHRLRRPGDRRSR
jgi:hypothetical protein